MESGFALFDTKIGLCGLAWTGSTLRGVQLPEASAAKARGELKRRFPDLDEAEPPPWVVDSIDALTAFLSGATETALAAIPIDLTSVGEWERRVYQAARDVPAGSTVTYGMLAARLGDPGKARAVGQALGRNPWPIVIPCHRITAAGGRMGGFSAPGGTVTKLKLLEIEGALAADGLPLFAVTH
ncbi:MAG TPA: methylated-DNA--[protein]-cysteine S-methyltransferase [Allosphingosinicella sp.]|nr:methylated-DNA--[protein]-cysteine S-methyltransferase [Allosphingosinicella sp.]